MKVLCHFCYFLAQFSPPFSRSLSKWLIICIFFPIILFYLLCSTFFFHFFWNWFLFNLCGHLSSHSLNKMTKLCVFAWDYKKKNSEYHTQDWLALYIKDLTLTCELVLISFHIITLNQWTCFPTNQISYNHVKLMNMLFFLLVQLIAYINEFILWSNWSIE